MELCAVGGRSKAWTMPSEIDLTEELIAFFGLYSGDGSKGMEDPGDPGVIRASIAFSQKEPNLVKFAVSQLKAIFSEIVAFQF